MDVGGGGLEAQVGIVPFKVIHCNIHSMKIVLSVVNLVRILIELNPFRV